jgi:hypothetical protein
MGFPTKDPRYRAYYNKKINRFSQLVIKETSDNCNFKNIFIYRYANIRSFITLLFGRTIVDIFIIIYQASQFVK